MDLTTVQYFLSLAECLNFSEAAEMNHISQSSFSKAIMRLERDLGVRLIDRSHHPVILTPAGKCFYDRMRTVIPQFQDAVDELSAFAKEKTLRLFICPRSFQYKMAIDDFLKTKQGIHIEVEETSDITLVPRMLGSGKYDFVISPRPFEVPEGIRTTRLCSDSLYLMVKANSHLAKRQEVSLKELDGLEFYETPYSKLLVQELSRRFGFMPKAVLPKDGKRMTRQEAIYRISMGMGVGIYAGRDLRPYRNAHMICIPLRETIDFPVLLLERENSKDSVAKRCFRKWIAENLERYVPERLDVERFNSKATDSDVEQKRG